MLVTYFDPGCSGSDFLNFRDHFFGPLQGSRVGKLDVQIEIALVFIGNKTRGQLAADPKAGHSESDQQDKGDNALSKDRPETRT